MIKIVPRGDAEAQVWSTALEVSRLFADVPWVLIGAQMVILLEHVAGRPSTRTTGDVDALVDVRALVRGAHDAGGVIEADVIRALEPPLNLTHVRTPRSSIACETRARMTQRARRRRPKAP